MQLFKGKDEGGSCVLQTKGGNGWPRSMCIAQASEDLGVLEYRIHEPVSLGGTRQWGEGICRFRPGPMASAARLERLM